MMINDERMYNDPNIFTFPDPQLFALQRQLFDRPEMRAKFNQEWRDLYEQMKSTIEEPKTRDLMREAIWQVRDRMLGRNKEVL